LNFSVRLPQFSPPKKMPRRVGPLRATGCGLRAKVDWTADRKSATPRSADIPENLDFLQSKEAFENKPLCLLNAEVQPPGRHTDHTTREAVMAARVGCNGSFHSDILNVPLLVSLPASTHH
jgi:hypothetical protein